MAAERLLLDTAFVQALLNRKDQYHARAKAFLSKLMRAREVWVTEAVLVEIGNALSALNREGAASFINQCYTTSNVRVVSVDTALLKRGLDLFLARLDKDWSLTDCISFVVMKDQGLTEAMTTDRHFAQAGFRALLREAEHDG